MVGFSAWTKEELGKHDIDLFGIRSALGERPLETGTTSMFEAINGIFEVDNIGKIISEVSKQQSTQELRTRLLNIQDSSEVLTMEKLGQVLSFVFDFINEWSQYATPGDCLKHETNNL